ncbi:MAG: PAS domain S-box protein [Longimonas sp.]|uniref:PAS domain-containing sensor histidine kinase n=1 Tax=Longimonas sp. TaxID=2039626 RepID=UPI0033584887
MAGREATLSEKSATTPDYQALYDTAPVAYFSVSPGGYIQMLNQYASELLGYERDALIGMSPLILYADTPSGREKAKAVLANAQSGTSVEKEELRMRRSDGTLLWVQLTVRPVKDEAGRIQRFQSIVTDITERKNAREKLRAAQSALEERVESRTAELRRVNEELRSEVAERRAIQEQQQRQLAAMDAAMAGMSIHEPDGTFRYANQAHATIYGYDAPDELIGRSWRILYEESEQAYIENAVFPVLEQGNKWSGELTGLRRDGSTFPAYLTLTPLDDGGLTCICEDITDRKEREQRLELYTRRLEVLRDIDQAILQAQSQEEIAQAAMERLQHLIPCSRSSVILINTEANEATVLARHSTAATELDSGTTYPLSDLHFSGEQLQEGAHLIEDIRTATQTPLIERLQHEGIRSFMTLPMQIDATVLGTVNLGAESPRCFTEQEQRIAKEVTDQLTIALRQAQLLDQVQQQTERLEQRVEERTKELESFTYSVSHDLRTPLRAVDGFSRMLLDAHSDQLDEEGQRLLGIVVESAQRMGQLIDDLLALSRLGSREMRAGSIDMEALVDDVISELKRAHPNRDIVFERAPLPDTCGDRSMVRQALTNLLSNAVKFTRGEAPARIHITHDPDAADPTYVVEDNGAGFDMNYADKLFGVFQRLHDEGSFEGTGVGLAIVERVVHRHGGRVWATGHVGKGATFSFSLPTETKLAT